LDKTTRILVPTPEDPLHVNGNDQLDLRLTKQGQLYIIAYTDIDTTTVSANVKLNYNCDFAKDSNPVFQPIQQNLLSCGLTAGFPSYTPATDSSRSYATSLTVNTEVGKWLGPVAAGGITVPAGTYQISTTARGSAKNTNATVVDFCVLNYELRSTQTITGQQVVKVSSTNMRNMAPSPFELAVPTATQTFMMTFSEPSKLEFRIGASVLSAVGVQMNNTTMEITIVPMILFPETKGTQVNSALLTKTHRVLPDYLKKKGVISKEEEQKEKVKAVDLDDQLQKEIEDEIRISQSIRQRRLSGLL